ncbi:flagellar basal-body MS-ring/collar protein FliF [Arthrobacter sp. H35-MC1]|nr:flagellar basal-body MS-ring/collar protein FliF [Arthrobacter sp. H35-MC1]MDJ0316645.1 flagellar basal-body MS-ring/collar protein FliF [Arthrobacter sp. H35-MC1]
MPPFLTAFPARFSGMAKGFTMAQKTLVVIGLAVLVLGSVALFSWVTKPSYAPLFSSLAPADANAIVTQLKTDNVPYQLVNGGATILVPDANVYDQRLKAASAGLPAATTAGYSLLDSMGVTSSEFQQNITYKRAMEGELAQTIMAMKGVTMASVKLAVPEQTVFTATKQDPTASVFVETSPGVSLSDDQVNAIVHLTSSSVEALKPANVSVVDAAGAVLSAAGNGATGSGGKQAQAYEQRVSAAVQSMLDTVVGPGNSSVTLSATMDNASTDRMKESFTSPEGAPALNESTSSEKGTGGAGSGAGVLGPDNIAVPGGAGDAGGTSESNKTTKNNAIDKVTENTVIPAGNVQRQSLAVAVDTAAAAKIDAATLTEMVSMAAGLNPGRGDTVSMKVVPFSTAQSEAAQAALDAAKAEAGAAKTAETWRNLGIAAVLLLLLLVVIVIYARKNRRQVRELVDLGEQSRQLVSLTKLPADPEPATTALTAIPVPAALPVAESSDADSKRASLEALAGADPQKTAGLLRSLMDEKVGV